MKMICFNTFSRRSESLTTLKYASTCHNVNNAGRVHRILNKRSRDSGASGFGWMGPESRVPQDSLSLLYGDGDGRPAWLPDFC